MSTHEKATDESILIEQQVDELHGGIMNVAKGYIAVASALFMLGSTFCTLGANAQSAQSVLLAESVTPTPAALAPISEPYEPGSSTVINDWQFSPGEKTTIATNYRSHHHHSGARCRNPHHHHSST